MNMAINPFNYQQPSKQAGLFGAAPSESERVRAIASVYPQILTARREAELAEERRRLDERAVKQQQQQANRARNIEIGKTALIDTGAYKPLWSKGIKPMLSTVKLAPQTLIQTTGLPLAEGISTGATYGTAGFGSAPSTINAGQIGATSAGIGSGGIASLGVANAIATTAAGFGAGQYAGSKNLGDKWFGKTGSEDFRDVSSGALSGALAGFLASGLNPIGAGVGAITGAIGSKNKCIIVSACTSPDSYEVEISREYRKNFMDCETIRGYYMIADQVVPLINKYESIRKAFKTELVDRLVDYGEVKLGMKESLKYDESRDVSMRFLSMCKKLGCTIPRYVRSNGEVV